MLHKPSLFIADTTAPFFTVIPKEKGSIINWSKNPFAYFQQVGIETVREPITTAFKRYVTKMRDLGFTAITIDDLAHLAQNEKYPIELQNQIAEYQSWYRELIQYAHSLGLHIFLTTDAAYNWHSFESQHIEPTVQWQAEQLATSIGQVCAIFPEISGIVFRFGEHDGKDVKNQLLSRKGIKTPADLQIYLRTLLPYFSTHSKKLILRTWSFGLYEIGDLIWNTDTYDAIFTESFLQEVKTHQSSLIISSKYGETDFFRYLSSNPVLLHTKFPTIIEFQPKREYEMIAGLPSFTGYAFEKIYKEITQKAHKVIGISMWIQTGGWGPPSNSAFIENNFWTELNTFVQLAHSKHGTTIQDAIFEFCNTNSNQYKYKNHQAFLELISLIEQTIQKGLYISEFAQQTLYFRRARLPTLAWIHWQNVLYNTPVSYIIRTFVTDKKAAIKEGYDAYVASKKMIQIAKKVGFPKGKIKTQIKEFAFVSDTYKLLALAREVMLDPYNNQIVQKKAQLLADIAKYHEAYPAGYYFLPSTESRFLTKRDHRLQHFVRITLLFIKSHIIRFFILLLIRKQSKYRNIDRILNHPTTTWVVKKIILHHPRLNPGFVQSQAMGVESLFL